MLTSHGGYALKVAFAAIAANLFFYLIASNFLFVLF